MNDPTINGGTWPTWLQQAMWVEWVQPVLYGLLAIAVVSLVLTLLDLAMLCWKEFHSSSAQKKTNSRPASGRATTSEPAAALKKRSFFASFTVKALLLLL